MYLNKQKSTMFKMMAQPGVVAENIMKQEEDKLVGKTKVKLFYEAVAADKLKFYCPNGANEKLINTVAHCTRDTDMPIILCTYANGVGKTTSVQQIIANIVYGPQNGWFDQGVFRAWPFPKNLWYVSTPAALEEKMGENGEDSILSLLKPGTYKAFKGNKKYVSKIEFTNGFTLRAFSFEQDPKEFESANVGLCLEQNQRILMADGTWKRIIDVNEGDKVVSYGSKHKWVRNKNTGVRMPKGQTVNEVTKKWVYNNKDIVKINCMNGNSIECTPDHKFWIYGKGWLEAKDIKPSMYVMRPDIKIEGEKTCELWEAKILGTLIGDGCLTRKSIHFTCYNDKLLEELRSVLPEPFKLNKIASGEFRPNRKEYRLTGQGGGHNAIKDWLKDIGIWGHKAHNKFIPDIIFKGTEEIKIAFLEGLYATDGWFTSRNIGYASTSFKLAQDLKLLLLSLGIHGQFMKRKSKVENWKDQWHFVISKSKEVIRFSNLIRVKSKEEAQKKTTLIALKARRNMRSTVSKYTDIDVNETPSQRKTRRKLKVKSVEYVGKSTVVDIETTPNHNFIVDGVLTHNCINDEPAPEAIWKAEKSRRRMGCITININTPLYAPPYLLEECVRNNEKGIKGYYWLEASVYEACVKRGIRGHLKPKRIDHMVAQYDPDEREARALGKFMYFSSAIYPEFAGANETYLCDIIPGVGWYKNETIYEIDEKLVMTKMIIDPKDGIQDATIYLWKLPNGRIIIFSELPDDKTRPYWELKKPYSPQDNVKAMVQKEIELGLEVNRRVMDKRFGWQTRGGKFISQEYSKIGIALSSALGLKNQNWTFLKSYNTPDKSAEIKYGHSQVRDYLKIWSDGLPGLLIGRNCYHVRNGLNKYIRRNETGKLAELKKLIDSPPIEKFKDFPDVVRYGICDDDFAISNELIEQARSGAYNEPLPTDITDLL